MTTKKINASNTESALCYLMAHDRKVCSIDRKTGYVEMFCETLLPLDLYLEWDSSADLFNNLQVFYWWCAHRILSIDREYAKNLLNSCGLKQASTDRDRAFIALQYKCLSLRDFFWVKSADDTSTWDQVNLFKNSLSNAVVDIALLGKSFSVTNKQLIDSDLATDGVFPKAWYRDASGFTLYKGDRNNSVTKEVRASQLLKEAGLDVLEYWETTYCGERVSACKCFTNENIGYVTAGDLNANQDIDTTYNGYFQMLLADYLVGNSDRHQDNWGYLFDESNHIIGFAPVFDFNHAFEADMEFTCLPELLLGRRKSALEAAKASYKELGITFSYVNETDDYSKFVNDRIRILRS